MPKGRPLPAGHTQVRLDESLKQHLRIHALALNVTQSKLIRDVLTLWTGYFTAPDDPRFRPEYTAGELPAVEEEYPGYTRTIGSVFVRG